MPNLREFSSKGMLREAWNAQVDDYAIVCGWMLSGSAFLVGDAVGGLYSFRSKLGTSLWQKKNVHEGGLLDMSIHPNGDVFATAGQDGKMMLWKAKEGERIKVLDLGAGWVEHLQWSPDGCFLAVAFSRYVYVFSSDGQKHWRSHEHPSTVSAIAWSNSNELATACYG